MINFLYNALNRDTITVHRDSERSWCYVGDTVRAIRMVIEHQKNWAASSWNIGRDDIAVPMLWVAEKACEMTGASTSIIQMVDAPGKQTVVKRLATEKIRQIGWKPEVDLGEGMKITLAWIEAGFPALQQDKE